MESLSVTTQMSKIAVLISCECLANIVKRGRACSEMLIVKTVETLFIPKVATIIKGVVFHASATQAEIGGVDNCNGHSRLDIVKGHRSGETPFVAEESQCVSKSTCCALPLFDRMAGKALNGLSTITAIFNRKCALIHNVMFPKTTRIGSKHV